MSDSKPKILAVIQARSGSKGIPKKNIYPINGHPLMTYSIAAAIKSELITEIYVSTDSEEFAQVAREYGAKAPFLRPDHLSGDKVTSVDSLHWAVEEIEKIENTTYDYVVELPAVSPLRDHDDIDQALTKLIETGADSIISMCDTGEKHPIRLKKIIDDQILDFTEEYPEPAAGSRRQDLKPISYIRNGAIYSMTRDCLIKEHSRHGKDSRPFTMAPERSVNIDEVMDLMIAEAMMKKGFCNNLPVKVPQLMINRVETGKPQKILVTTNTSFLPTICQKIEEDFDVIYAENVPSEEIAKLLPEVDGWICSPCPKYQIDADLLSKATKLKVLASPSTGSNHVDKDFCEKNNISFFCLKGTDFVSTITASSEFTFALVLEATRNLSKAVNLANQGYWREIENDLRGIELSDKTLGIIGYGRIGSNNARMANAFKMNVVSYDPNVEIKEDYVSQVDSHEKVLEQSDVVMVCVHLDDSTHGMVNASWFNKMKDGVYFINSSRGEVLNETDLLASLESGKIKSAAVDVISAEMTSDKRKHPLVQYAANNDNLTVTPHIAGLTIDSERKAAEITLESVVKALKK
jgi:phosphoglycerate dehydrogenase-like enzyme/CMP-N-acetylneuraminic acid synthetase